MSRRVTLAGEPTTIERILRDALVGLGVLMLFIGFMVAISAVMK